MAEELAPGDHFGDFVVEELVGRGGMGLVYRAVQGGLGRKVALKIIAPHLAEDPVFQDRFRREARQAAAIDYPAIIPVYAAGEIEGRLYLAMRYVTGTDLSSLLMAEGHLTPGRTFAILGQIAGALDAAHAGGLVHRDVKPANILIERASGGRERAYLTDFGLVRHTADAHLTQTGSWLGTVNYMPPEQFKAAGAVDGRADQYSLACVAYEMLAGAPPFPRDSDPQAMFAHLNDPPPRLTEVRTELPAEMDAVLARGMAKAPADRFDSCSAFVTALVAAAGDFRHTASLFDAAAGPPVIAPTVIDAPIPAAGAVAATQAGTTDGSGARRPPARSARATRDRWALLGGLAVVIIAAAIVVVLVTSGTSQSPTKSVSAGTKHTATTGAHTTTSASAGLIANGLPITAKGVLTMSASPTDGSVTYKVNSGKLGTAVMRMTYDATLLRIRYAGPKLAFDWVLNQPSSLLRWACSEGAGKPTECYPHATIPHRPGEVPSQLGEDTLVLDGDVVSRIATKQLTAAFKPLADAAKPPAVTLSHQANMPVACFTGKVDAYSRTLCVNRAGQPTYVHIAAEGEAWIDFSATSATTLLGTGAFNPPAKLH